MKMQLILKWKGSQQEVFSATFGMHWAKFQELPFSCPNAKMVATPSIEKHKKWLQEWPSSCSKRRKDFILKDGSGTHKF